MNLGQSGRSPAEVPLGAQMTAGVPDGGHVRLERALA
jgi:hypothetical protein